MRLLFDRAIVADAVEEAIRAGVGAKLSFVPDGQFHRERREQRRLDAAPAQTGAYAELAAILRQSKSRGRAVIAVESGIMRRAAEDQIQRNQVAGIEQMINAGRNFAAVAVERLVGIIFAAVDFVVTVRKTAAGQADGEVRVRPQPVDKAEFGIEIHRRDRQPQRQVRAQKIRLVVIVKRVAGERRVALECLVVAELDQVALYGVNLRRRENRGEQRQPEESLPDFFHRHFRNPKPRCRQADLDTPVRVSDYNRGAGLPRKRRIFIE